MYVHNLTFKLHCTTFSSSIPCIYITLKLGGKEKLFKQWYCSWQERQVASVESLFKQIVHFLGKCRQNWAQNVNKFKFCLLFKSRTELWQKFFINFCVHVMWQSRKNIFIIQKSKYVKKNMPWGFYTRNGNFQNKLSLMLSI